MAYLVLKFALSALVVVLASEFAKRSTLVGALLASLPLTSILAMIWLYRDTGSVERVATLSREIFILVLPSLVLFVALPVLLKRGYSFALSMGLACGLTTAAYALVMTLRSR